MDVKVSVEQSGEVTRNVEIAIPHEMYDAQFDAALAQAIPRVRIKGFRPGRAPKAVVAKMHGDALHQDVVSKLINDAYNDAVREHDLRVVGNPSIDLKEFKKGEDLCFTAKVDVFPEPKIENYEALKIEVEVEPEEVSDEDVQAELDGLRERFASLEPIEGRDVVEDGDIATVDFSGTVEGEPFAGSDRKGVVLEIGKSERFVDFDKALIGLKVGEESEVEVTLPEDIGDDKIGGKKAVYQVLVHKLERKELPELDDELAKKTQVAQTIDELRDYIKNTMQQQKKEQNKNLRQTKLFEAILEKNDFDVPQTLVDEEIREILFEMGLLDRRKEESYKINVAQFRDSLNDGARFRVRRYILLEQIIDQENFEIKDADVDAWLDAQAEESKVSREEVEKAFGLPDNERVIRKMITREQMTEKLLADAKIKDLVKKPDAGDKK